MKAYLNIRTYIICLLLALPFGSAMADEFSDTVDLFRNAGESSWLTPRRQ